MAGVTELGPASRVARPGIAGLARSRIVGLDVARSVAMLGMAITHYGPGMAGVFRPNGVIAFWDGRAMPLFILLAGAGVVILGSRAAHPVREIIGRCALLFAIGLWLDGQTISYLILQYYAIFLIVGMLLRGVRDRTLLWLGAVVILAGGAAQIWLKAPLSEHSAPAFYGHLGSLPLLWHPRTLLYTLLAIGEYPFFPSFAFVLAGMWLARRPLTDARWLRRLLVAGVALALATSGIAALSRHYEHPARGYVVDPITHQDVPTRAGLKRLLAPAGETSAQWMRRNARRIAADPGYVRHSTYVSDVGWHSPWRLLRTTEHSQMPGWVLNTLGFALAVVAAAGLLALRLARTARPFALAGQLALTFYLGHLLIAKIPGFRGFVQQPGDGVLKALIVWASFIVLATLWRSRFQRGPFEAILRLAGRATAHDASQTGRTYS